MAGAGVTIGKNTTIGAGSVVTKDIPADCVAVGNPCRVIKKWDFSAAVYMIPTAIAGKTVGGMLNRKLKSPAVRVLFAAALAARPDAASAKA